MRRFAALLAAAVLLLTACGKKQPELEEPKNNNRAAVMTIVRTEFSQETEDILKLLDTDGLAFFDFAVDNTVNAYSMNVWVKNDGKWLSSGGINGRIEDKQGRVGVQLLEDGCNFFQLKDAGHTKYSVKYDDHLDECTATGRMALEETEQVSAIEPGKEQYLILNLGWKEEHMDMDLVTEDFRNSDCDAGVAVTITFAAAAS